MPELTVTRNDDASRYEIHSDGILAGFTEFKKRPGEILFVHTEIDHAFAGRGLASALAADALADAAAGGDTIVPYCEFIAKYLTKHEVPGAQIRWPKAG